VRRSRSRAAVRARPASRPSSSRPRHPSPAEAALLELAQVLGAIAAAPSEGDAVAAVLSRLEQAFGPGAALPRQLAQAWLRTRGDKTRALALGWAREQVRRGLAEALLRKWARTGGRAGTLADTAAWLLLAVAEAEAHEPGGVVGDRLRAVCDLIGRPARP